MSARVAGETRTKKSTGARYCLGVSTAASINDLAIEKRKRQIERQMSLEGKRVLDMGCGNGLYTIELGRLAKGTVGIDISREALSEAIKNRAELGGGMELIQASAESLPLRGQSFDVVLAIEMLEHVQSDDRALEEAGRVLKDEGCLLIYVPNKLYPFDTHGLRIGQRYFEGLYGGSIPFFSWCPQWIRNRFECARIYTKGQIAKLLEKRGFTIRAVDYIYPPLDRPGSSSARSVLRKIMAACEQNRFLKRFGMSMLIAARKRET